MRFASPQASAFTSSGCDMMNKRGKAMGVVSDHAPKVSVLMLVQNLCCDARPGGA